MHPDHQFNFLFRTIMNVAFTYEANTTAGYEKQHQLIFYETDECR